MKGMFEFTESFLKMLTTAYLAVMLLGIFFALNNYYVYFEDSELGRDVLALGDGMLTANCLTEKYNGLAVKGLLSESSLAADSKRSISCIKFGSKFRYNVTIDTPQKEWSVSGGNTDLLDEEKSKSSLFPASVKTTTGEILPAILNVTVEQK